MGDLSRNPGFIVPRTFLKVKKSSSIKQLLIKDPLTHNFSVKSKFRSRVYTYPKNEVISTETNETSILKFVK